MLDIKRMGYHCAHDGQFFIDKPDGFDNFLMLFIKTRAYVLFDEKKIFTEPDTFILFNRKSAQFYGAADEGGYVNDWMEFDAEDSQLLSSHVIFDTPVYIGGSIDVSQYFRLISDCFYKNSNVQAETFLLKALLSEVFSDQGPLHSATDVPHHRELLDLRQHIYSHPEHDWTVEHMSDYLHMSKPYFQELYKSAFGVTCMADVINSRVEMAKTYLGSNTLSIDEIGEKCGYKSTVHFSRQFKQVTGTAPSRWK